MLTLFEGRERARWRLPCFRNEEYIILSDSQFRDIVEGDLERIEDPIFFCICVHLDCIFPITFYYNWFFWELSLRIKLRRKSGNLNISFFLMQLNCTLISLIANLNLSKKWKSCCLQRFQHTGHYESSLFGICITIHWW